MKKNQESIKLKNREKIFDKNYTIIVNRQLGKGGFGQIYLGRNIKENTPIAIKVEDSSNRSHLHLEYEILKDIQGGIGIPRIFKYRQGQKHNYLIMELLGKVSKNYLVITKNVSHIKQYFKSVIK